MKVVASYESFTAIHDHMPGAANSLRVSGTVVFNQADCEGRLERGGGDASTNPYLLFRWNLYLTTPSGPAAQVLTPQELTWSTTIRRPSTARSSSRWSGPRTIRPRSPMSSILSSSIGDAGAVGILRRR
jgi:hypothetical protein